MPMRHGGDVQPWKGYGMTRIKDEDYAYATARVRAVEVHLLDSVRLEQLLASATLADGMKLLAEARYGTGASSAEQGWEALLDGELARCYAFLAGLIPNPEVLDVFRLREDYLNLKLMLKSLYQGRDVAGTTGDAGMVPIAQLALAIVDNHPGSLPETMGKAMTEAMLEFGKRADPRDIDLVLDRAVYRHMNEKAAEIGHPFLMELVSLMSDMANIRIYIRGRLTGQSRDFFSRALLEGGKVDASKFRDASEKPMEVFLESIRYTWFGDAAMAGMDGYKAGRGITSLEKQLDDRFMDFVRRARFVAMGLEAIVGHLLARETEIRNVRIILTGKGSGLSHEDIRERLRLAYV